jgi:hypothetical protein
MNRSGRRDTPSIKYITRGYEAPLIQNRRSHAYPYRLRALLRISADNAYDFNVERAVLVGNSDLANLERIG